MEYIIFFEKMSMDDVWFSHYENGEIELQSVHSNQNQTAIASNSSSIEY